MAAIQAIHECLFCSQTFGTAAAKDDHVLEHFAQETCTDCNRDLIRIGGSLYVKHDASICSIKAPKYEKPIEPLPTVVFAPPQEEIPSVSSIKYEPIKSEQQVMSEESSESIDFEVLDRLDDFSTPSTVSEDDNQSITSDIECKLQELLCRVETNIDSEQTEQNGKRSRDSESAVQNQTQNITMDLARKSKGLGEIQCEICPSKFQTNRGLKRHMRITHDPNGTLFCRTCLKIFLNAEDFDAHRVECTTNATIKYECILCKRVYTQKFLLRRHMKMNHDPTVKTFKCETCGHVYMKESTLRNHLCKGKKVNPLSLRDLIPCEACGKILTRGSMRSHQLRIHSAPGTIFCRACSKIFSNADDLKAHTPHCKVKIKDDIKSRCDTCGKIYGNAKILSRHKLALHSAPGTIVCRICVKKFKTAEELTAHKPECSLKQKLQKQKKLAQKKITNEIGSHMRTKHEPMEDKYKCETCGNVYMNESTLRKHQCNAEDLKAHRVECTTKATIKYECVLCKTVYTQNFRLRRHMRTKHESMEDKYKCETCGNVYMKESTLRKHQCNGKKVTSDSQKDLIPCEACGKILTRGSMRLHQLRIHTAPGTIFCRACAKIFPNADDLEAHTPLCSVKIKDDIKSPCEICGKIYANAKALSKHKIALHSAPGTIACRICVKKFKTAEELTAHKPECTLKRKLHKQKQKEKQLAAKRLNQNTKISKKMTKKNIKKISKTKLPK